MGRQFVTGRKAEEKEDGGKVQIDKEEGDVQLVVEYEKNYSL